MSCHLMLQKVTLSFLYHFYHLLDKTIKPITILNKHVARVTCRGIMANRLGSEEEHRQEQLGSCFFLAKNYSQRQW